MIDARSSRRRKARARRRLRAWELRRTRWQWVRADVDRDAAVFAYAAVPVTVHFDIPHCRATVQLENPEDAVFFDVPGGEHG